MQYPDLSRSRRHARVAGALYLVVAVSGGFAIAYVPAQLAVPGDPAAALSAIAEQRGLFLAGTAGDAVMMGAELALSALLFVLLRSFGPVLALAAMAARLMMVAVMAAMLLFHAGTLALADGALSFQAFDPAQRAEMAGLLRHMHDAGVWIWQVFFALHLWLLGWLVARSGLYPRVFGPALALGGAGYLLDSVQGVVGHDLVALTAAKIALLSLVTLAEIGFGLWLLLRGPRVQPIRSDV